MILFVRVSIRFGRTALDPEDNNTLNQHTVASAKSIQQRAIMSAIVFDNWHTAIITLHNNSRTYIVSNIVVLCIISGWLCFSRKVWGCACCSLAIRPQSITISQHKHERYHMLSHLNNQHNLLRVDSGQCCITRGHTRGGRWWFVNWWSSCNSILITTDNRGNTRNLRGNIILPPRLYLLVE